MTTTEHHITYNVYNRRLLCSCDTSIGHTEAELTNHLLDVGRDEGRQDGYNAGLAAAKGELVAADDPRIKPGARVRLEWDDGDVAEGVVDREGLVFDGQYHIHCGLRVYLLAEAPDPDAEVWEAMGKAAPWLADCNINEILTGLRALNFDVVKAVAK